MIKSKSFNLGVMAAAICISVALLFVFTEKADAAGYTLKISGTDKVTNVYDNEAAIYPTDLIYEQTITVVDDKGVSRDFKYRLTDLYDKDWNMMVEYGFYIYSSAIWEEGFEPNADAENNIGKVKSFRMFIYKTDNEGNPLDKDGNEVTIDRAEILAATDPIRVKIFQHNPTITEKGINYTILMTSIKDGVNVYVDDSKTDPKSIKGKVTIPKEVTIKGKKYPVRVIGAPGLANCKNMTEVVLPDTITTIGIGSFVNTGLKRITIPDSVKSIIGDSIGTYQKTADSELTTVKGFVIYAKNNPVAEDYAYSMGIKYIDGKRAKAFKTSMKAKRAKGRKAKLTWVKNKYVTGYQIYKANKKKGKYTKAATIKKPGTVKWTSKKMKKGKRVYFKMRTYTKIGNKTFLGKWSQIKSVKIK